MKTLLIIYPHWHPANLAGVHRPRLTGNFLPEFGWKVRVLTVEEKYFEEKPDPDFYKTFRDSFEVTRVPAKKVRKPRIIGDIGLRAYKNMKRKALEILKNEQIDFIWIPVPSFYTALLGPFLYKKTGVPYGIDYIDPWVRDLTNQKNIRAVLSQWIARKLEPRALKKAALITGVSENYYMPAIHRNKLFDRKPKPVKHAAFPYGFDPNDHNVKIDKIDFPWQSGKKIWLYTGAFLPNSHYFVNNLFKAISELRAENDPGIEEVQFWFLGTGPYPAKRITQYAEDHGISDLVFEIRERFPFLHTLNFQSSANTVMIIGSTEKHYTASKTYQSLLSEKPVFSILHEESQAMEVLKECNADKHTIAFRENMTSDELVYKMKKIISSRLEDDHWSPDLKKLDKYSAKASSEKLSAAMENILEQRSSII